MKINYLHLLIFSLLLFSVGCKKASVLNPLGSSQKCESDAEKYSNAISVFANQQTNANCLSVKSTLQAAVKSCAIGLYANADAYKDLDCSQF